MSAAEHEITAPVSLVGADGRFAPAARGFSRTPLHASRLAGPWGRRKRWHYWCVTSPREIVSLTYADLDYLGLAVAVVIDRASGRRFRALALEPGAPWRKRSAARGAFDNSLPERASEGEVVVRGRRFGLVFRDLGAEILLLARARTRAPFAIDVRVTRPADHETLGVAVAWGARHFAYTSKHSALPAHGSIVLDGERRALAAGARACLDFGRGVWPWQSRWNWASAAGEERGRVIGLNLGAQWTAGAGPSENALVLDGRLHKIEGEVSFAFERRDLRRPWRLHGRGVELAFEPAFVEHPRLALGLAGAELCLAFGTFRGRVLGHDIGALFGWAEDFRARW